MQDNSINNEELKEIILNNEEKKEYNSSKFADLENIVKGFIQRQDSENTLKTITLGAINLGASDIHYDHRVEDIIVRFRIDGVLVDIFALEKKYYKLLLEKIKHSSNLKLNITNIPQDGKHSVDLGDKKIDVRVSTLPTPYGENAVCRLLDAKKAIIDFDELGFFWTTKRMLEKAISKKNGLILVTGPTGSGKTTTLYTILSKLNSRDRKIITLEDPIEYELPGVIQSEVNEKNGYNFSMGLKALLRQDPDIIMMGEIRDAENLDIATQASLTGHLVLSTLHTKSAGDTLDRIINMGLKPYILASALDTIIAQRLVRKICENCKVETKKSKEETQIIKHMMKEIGMNSLPADNIKLFTGLGCEKCNNSGYKGRIGIYEILSLNDEIRELIRSGASAQEIISTGRKLDMITMKEDGILKSLKGFTTIQEVLKII
ncbi:type II/IV secretion system protein [Candidatus Gracilibacteria bacterium]|nr:type II/IV secretion system protein [Candidatus Gracilibacteria bacterium]